MRYLKQFAVILTVTCMGEIIKYMIDLPVPGSIYGLILMLILLMTGAVKLEAVKDAADFLVEIMPLMFIPAAAGLLDSYAMLQEMLLPLIVIIPLTTCLVVMVSGKVTELVLKMGKGGKKDA